VPTDPSLPDVFTRAIALDGGLTRNQIEHRLVTGRWHRLLRGAFCEADRWEAAGPLHQHLLLARAVLLTRTEPGPLVLSHATAAVLHELPVSTPLLRTVWSTATPESGRCTRYEPPLRGEVAPLPRGHSTTRSGLPVTVLGRTVADCLRHLPLEESVPLGDAALRQDLERPGTLPRELLEQLVAWQASWPYAQSAARALRLLDPRRESVLESRSAIAMDAHGLPAPEPQAVIRDRNGDFVARVDFLWPGHRVIGEADGAGKYRAGDPADVIRREKDRQARLEALGFIVVRWDWTHLYGDPPELVVRLRRALHRAAQRNRAGDVA
jgi:very-short-patch-repair endonuclease